MKILPKSTTKKGPPEWFTGDVEIQPLEPVSENSKLSTIKAVLQIGTTTSQTMSATNSPSLNSSITCLLSSR